MDQPALLDRLAAACGVVLEYHDIWGRLRRADEACLLSILHTMGVDTSDDAALETALAERERRGWRELLPPVLVLRLPIDAIRVPFQVAEAQARVLLGWRLEYEEGRHIEGGFAPADLPVTERREIDGETMLRCEFALPGTPPTGYHRFVLSGDDGAERASMRLIVAPERCYTPEGLQGEARIWGPGAQLYALRSPGDWGIGDFSSLGRLVEIAGGEGAGIVGVSPIHALPSHNPLHRSPYSPWSRTFINHLHLDVQAVEEFAECPEARRHAGDPAWKPRLDTLRESEFVRYDRVARAKRPVLEMLYVHFRRNHLEPGTPRGDRFREFQRERGETLRAYGTFEALQEHLHSRDHSIRGWIDWPERYRRPESPAVTEFAEKHLRRVEFFEYLQWQCDLQLRSVGRRCLEQGMSVGLYQDLAVGVDRAGFEAWWNRDVMALAARAGAPPDDFNLTGQDWGLVPQLPDGLRATGYEPFIQCLRANMRHAGALRIDHVMGMMRLFWVPEGREPIDGAYVCYPFQDLLGVLTLESQRNRCLVIGEDLGTVPDEVRESLAAIDVLACRLLYFTKEGDGRFAPPEHYPRQAMVAVTTHDLPTLAGYWGGRDLQLRDELKLFPNESVRENQISGRTEDRPRLLHALRDQGLLPPEIGEDAEGLPEMTAALVDAIHGYLARTPAKVLIVQLEDVVGQPDQVNLPGTTDEYPNWKLRLALDSEQLAGDARLHALGRVLRRERGSGSRRPDGEPVPS